MERWWSCRWRHSTIRLAAAHQLHWTSLDFLYMFAHWERQMNFEFPMLICFHFFSKTWPWFLIFAFYRHRCTCTQIPHKNIYLYRTAKQNPLNECWSRLSERTWNEVTVPREILLETCVTEDSANNNCRWKLPSMASFCWEVIKCATKKEYYEKPRHLSVLRSLWPPDSEKNKSWKSLLFINWALGSTLVLCITPCLLSPYSCLRYQLSMFHGLTHQAS